MFLHNNQEQLDFKYIKLKKKKCILYIVLIIMFCFK